MRNQLTINHLARMIQQTESVARDALLELAAKGYIKFHNRNGTLMIQILKRLDTGTGKTAND